MKIIPSGMNVANFNLFQFEKWNRTTEHKVSRSTYRRTVIKTSIELVELKRIGMGSRDATMDPHPEKL